MDDKTAIKVEGVSKSFRLPHEKTSTLKGAFTNILSPTKRGYKTQQTLKNISFEVKEGEFFGIVGRNGSGKSTLLKILAGIYQPNKGMVHIRGKVVPFIELGVGFNPELSGRENVFLNGALLGFSKKDMLAMYDDIVEFAELKGFMDQRLKNFSSGMQVRLAFSLAIRSQADILLIDEVLAVGDADFQRKCYEYFKTLKHNKKTVIFVSHDMSAVREYCDRAVLIDETEVIQSGAVDQVVKGYQRLFTQQASGGKITENNRWGDGSVVTEKISTELSSTLIVINQVIKANQKIDSFVAGFRIRDSGGREVTGTNTRIEGCLMPTLEKGEKIKLRWELPNLLAEGDYYIDPALIYSDGVTVADWWDEALRLKINKGRHLPYPVDPGFQVTVQQ